MTMPEVSLTLEIAAPIRQVWTAVTNVGRYAESMVCVRSAEIVEQFGPQRRRTAFSVTLKGSILEWQELEQLDHERHVVDFDQVSGDLERFSGAWRLTGTGPESCLVTLGVSFEIGIPLLADMLNPVAQRALRDNCTDMLRGVERQALAPHPTSTPHPASTPHPTSTSYQS
jgi:ribosome-associated toxin RatA of RatAB toxin-antitoxin module